ncbi:hypothetical protein F5Y18DRAFT_382108 [Xylariaceae sp. FL1019]|nr:hypothetical protein F5Y18DRAFT_382108 [Xylariaceae sp. FL1019]
MATGLDELIESLLTEIAFSGIRGCTIECLLDSIRSIHKEPQKVSSDSNANANAKGKGKAVAQEATPPETSAVSQPDQDARDLAVASKVWSWLVGRQDVSVGVNRQFNRSSLEEVLAMPEEPDAASSAQTDTPTDGTSTSSAQTKILVPACSVSKDDSAAVRPRLFVSEDRLWKTLTGHGPDLKRVPLFEWKALVDIASVKATGILQGDLVRLTGQDKRSLPTRTDALARKGYIIKQPICVRGFKTSKLWLVKFAENAKVEEELQGLDLANIDLSKETLTKDLDPLPFCDKWIKEPIDYLALAQAFVAIAKAWALIRYVDARVKMGVEVRQRQMRALAKTTRWLCGIGSIMFVAARFSGSNRLFKDCVKFVRDPTPAEWEHFRSTPKTRMTLPSGRIGQRGAASRAASILKKEKNQASGAKKGKGAKARHRSRQAPIISAPWKPQKLIMNTTFDIIKRAGPRGTSNAAIIRQTLGHNYRRYTSALTRSISTPVNVQPEHLKDYSSISELQRIGKTMTYKFFSKDEMADSTADDGRTQRGEGGVNIGEDIKATEELDSAPSRQLFSNLAGEEFLPAEKISPTVIDLFQSGTIPRQKLGRPKKRKRGVGSVIEEESPAPTLKESRSLEFEPKRLRLDTTPVQSPDEQDAETPSQQPLSAEKPPLAEAPSVAEATRPEDSISLLPRPPGASRAPPNSLDTVPNRKGRRPKSLVICFRSEKLKDPSFLGITSGLFKGNRLVSGTPSVPPDASQHTDTPGKAAGPSKVKRSKKLDSYKCEKCGNAWKNSNGLEYHLNKSRTACNPSYVPPPPAPLPVRKQKGAKAAAQGGLQSDKKERPTLEVPQGRLSQWEQVNARLGPRKTVLNETAPPSSSLGNSALADGNAILLDSEDDAPVEIISGPIKLKELQVYDATYHVQKLATRSSYTEAGPSMIEEPDPDQSVGNFTPHQPKTPAIADIPSDAEPKPSSSSSSVPRRQASGKDTIPNAPPQPQPQPKPRKPLPTLPPNKPRDPQEAHSMRESNVSTTKAKDKASPKSGRRSLASFALPTRGNASFTTRRRDRTYQIITYLLNHNGGVFPGSRSLFMALISVWVNNFEDLGPPDRRSVLNITNQMQREGILRLVHFFFFDNRAKMQESTVLVEMDDSVVNKSPEELSATPRVVAVKEKLREMYPETYVPDGFSLRQDELKLFDELGSSGAKGKNADHKPNHLVESELIHNIETLDYDAPIIGDASSSVPRNKRTSEAALSESQSPHKRRRLSAGEMSASGTPVRKWPGVHEMWDSGKLAAYIWSERQKPGGTTDEQTRPSRQGTPSTPFAAENPGANSLRSILSAVKSHQEIDKTAKLMGRRSWRVKDIHVGGTRNHDKPDDDELLADPFVRESTPALSVADSTTTDDTFEGADEPNQPLEPVDNMDDQLQPFVVEFAPAEIIQSKGHDCWPKHSSAFFEQGITGSFATEGSMPTFLWFLQQNLPRCAQDILKSVAGQRSWKTALDPVYCEFVCNVNAIENWEQSKEGAQMLTRGSIVPDYSFICLELDQSRADMKPVQAEWLGTNQYTPSYLPNEIRNFQVDGKPRTRGGNKRGRPRKARGGLTRESAKAPPRAKPKRRLKKPPKPTEYIEYKTRALTFIPKQPRGRVNKPAAHDDRLGSKREDELIAACVAVRTLLGGIDRSLDVGLLLKLFPGMSLSALKKFWPRVSRERRSYCEGLTTKFQSAFLEAYESGKIKPIDYDDIANYDWPALILWTTKLETHEDIDLPDSRQALSETHVIGKAANQVIDWRDTWFALTSTYNRIEAVSSENMSIPWPPTECTHSDNLFRARTWVRSLCCTSLQGVDVDTSVVPKLLELGNGDSAVTNQTLDSVVKVLNEQKVIVKTKGKGMGGNFRLHMNFAKSLDKMASTVKFRQAFAFKKQLDDCLRGGEQYVFPYASNDGTIMAVLNLQACGRVIVDAVELPNIPFGFEPGNYEGRLFPKSYYHFKVRIGPSPNYIFSEDMPLLSKTQVTQPPMKGPDGAIPIWVDFFGNLNMARFSDYLCMVVFTLASKGPVTPEMCVTLLKPMIDQFEVELIIEWLDQLGLLYRVVDGCRVTVAEWWWLVAGQIVELGDATPTVQEVLPASDGEVADV